MNEEGERSNKEPEAVQPEEFPKAPYPRQNSLTSPINEEEKPEARNQKPSRQKSSQKLLTPIRIP